MWNQDCDHLFEGLYEVSERFLGLSEFVTCKVDDSDDG
jgi:hypothetical protein